MTREELIRMATQAGWEMPTQWDSDDGFLVRLEHFAELVVAAEREACAKLCQEMWTGYGDLGAICASAIRARSER